MIDLDYALKFCDQYASDLPWVNVIQKLVARVRELERCVRREAEISRDAAEQYVKASDRCVALEADAEAVRAETTRQTDKRIDAYRALEAENARLREALKAIETGTCQDICAEEPMCTCCAVDSNIARAVLAPATSKETP